MNAPALLTADYGAFLSAHLEHLVGRRYFKREWPQELARAARVLDLLDVATLALTDEPLQPGDLPDAVRVRRDVSDIASRLSACAGGQNAEPSTLSRIPVMRFLGDWYRVRMGSDLGLDAIAPDRLSAYRLICRLHAVGKPKDGTVQATFERIFRMFGRFISGLPSGNFTIDLATGDVEAS
jgi:hypothetical protein